MNTFGGKYRANMVSGNASLWKNEDCVHPARTEYLFLHYKSENTEGVKLDEEYCRFENRMSQRR